MTEACVVIILCSVTAWHFSEAALQKVDRTTIATKDHTNSIQILMNGCECNGTDIFMR